MSSSSSHNVWAPCCWSQCQDSELMGTPATEIFLLDNAVSLLCTWDSSISRAWTRIAWQDFSDLSYLFRICSRATVTCNAGDSPIHLERTRLGIRTQDWGKVIQSKCTVCDFPYRIGLDVTILQILVQVD